MTSIQQKSGITVEEYLRMERQAEEKSEFYQGECFAMAGSSRQHNLLAKNLLVALDLHLRGKPCDPYMADMRLNIDSHAHYVYPDVFVVCQEEAYVAEDMTNDATVIAEVLSPSTESYDRGKKFLHYQSLPSLQEYLLISQEVLQVEIFRRKQHDWSYQALAKPEDRLILPSLDFAITLAELYQSVLLSEAS